MNHYNSGRMVCFRDNMTALLDLTFFSARGYPRGMHLSLPSVASGYSCAYQHLGISLAPRINGLLMSARQNINVPRRRNALIVSDEPDVVFT
jgi:hypothetical protein